MSTKPNRWPAACFVCTTLLICGSVNAWEDAEPPAIESHIQAEVARLINQLGHPSYAQRSRARGELERLGLVAFDALHAAQTHEDSEIAMQARYLVESLHVSWYTDEDTTEVQEILENYGSQSEVERKSRMDRLAALPDRVGLRALCRLVRFETKLRLSRAAALVIMQQDVSNDPTDRNRNSGIIQNALGANERVAAKWLNVYASDLAANHYSADLWNSHIQAERRRVAGHTTKTTDDLALIDLYRICAVRAKELGEEQESLRLAHESLELVEGRKQPLRNAAEWALDHQFWPVVITLFERETEDFKADAWLMYAVAEALTEIGRGPEAERLVVDALELAPMAELDAEGASPMSTDEREQMVRRHLLVAIELVQRGRFAWAEREYNYVIQRSPIDSVSGADARLSLSMVLADIQRYEDASALLEPVVDRMLKDSDFRRQVQRDSVPLETYESKMHYFSALSNISLNNVEAARNELVRALEANPVDGDIIIAMFRLPGDESWKLEVEKGLRSASTEFLSNIKAYERIAGNGQNQISQMVAFYCNQYAWLISNTKGDFNRALSYSQRSIELVPNSATYLDTLGRCYFAVGDLNSAVKTQRHALSLEPHSPPIQRQLEEFLKHQSDSKRPETSSAAEG